MSTSYVISVGYTHNNGEALVWSKLKEIALSIANQPDLIHKEAIICSSLNSELLREYCEPFRNCNDLTFRIDETEKCVRLLASGGDHDEVPSRDLKEDTRKAFLRLVLREMHRNQMNVNMNVY